MIREFKLLIFQQNFIFRLASTILFLASLNIAFGQVVNKASGSIELVLQSGHEGIVQYFDQWQDRWLVSSGSEGHIKLWNLQSGLQQFDVVNPKSYSSALIFHPSGKYFLSSSDKVINVWSTEEGKLIDKFPASQEEVKALVFNKDGTKLASGDSGGHVIIWDFQKRKKLVMLKAKADYAQGIEALVFTKDARYLFVGGQHIELQQWEWKKKKLIHSFDTQETNTTNSIALNVDETLLAAAGDYAKIKIWKIADSQLVQDLFENNPTIESIAFHPTQTHTLFAGYMDGFIDLTGGGLGGTQTTGMLKAWDVNIGKSIWSKTTKGAVLGLLIDPLGKSLTYVGDSRNIIQHATKTGEFQQNIGIQSIPAKCIAIHPHKDFLLAGYANGELIVWDIKTGSLHSRLFEDSELGPLTAIGIHPNKDLLLTAYSTKIFLWETNDSYDFFKLKNSFEVEKGIVEKLFFFEKNENILLVRNNQKEIMTEGLKLLEFLSQGKEIENYSPQEESLKSAYIDIYDSLNGEKKASITSYDGVGSEVEMKAKSDIVFFTDSQRNSLMFDLNSGGVLMQEIFHEDIVTASAFSKDGSFLVSGGLDNYFLVWDFNAKQQLQVHGLPAYLTDVVFSANNKVIYLAADKYLIKGFPTEDFPQKKIHFKKSIQQIQLNKDNNFLYILNDAGEIHVHLASDLTRVLRFVNLSQQDYLTINTQGYYRGTKLAVRAIGFKDQEQRFGFEQFDLFYNRPDKIMKQLGSKGKLYDIYYKAFEKRKSAYQLTSEILTNHTAPQLSVFLEGNKTSTNTPTIPLNIDAKDTNSLLTHVQVFINGVPLFADKGKALNPSAHIKEQLILPLSLAKNLIQVQVINQFGIKSPLQYLSVFCDALIRKTDLYILTIGADKYQQENYDLDYPDDDAKTIQTLMSTQSYSYNNIIANNLIGEEVTVENIRTALAQLKKSKEDDTVIIFYAGHGIIAGDKNYYFSSYKTNFVAAEKTAFAFNELEQALKKIKARQRLLLIDACHAGQIDKEGIELIKIKNIKKNKRNFNRAGSTKIIWEGLNEREAFNAMQEVFVNLANNSGATIIAGSRGEEYAIESDEYQNGIFTSCIKTALNGLSADTNNDGQIVLSELEFYLSKTVSELTNGEQRPIARSQNLYNDFCIFKEKE